jgi:3-oxoacyl-[acyl-carrier-protein] synthase II
VGAVTPLGTGAERLYRRWRAGEVAIEDGVGRCRDFNPADHLSRREIRSADRFSQVATVAVGEALENAGWGDDPPYDPERIGCVLATSVGGIQTCIDQHDRVLEKGEGLISPLAVVMQMPNAGAAMIAQKWGFRGECCAVVAACASGTLAFGAARRLLFDGTLDAVVLAGADAAVLPHVLAAFTVMGALSKSGIVRPFDRRRDGFVVGEGAGALVLERPEAASARGAPALGEVIGFGATTDAYDLCAPKPSGADAARAITRALASADLDASDVDYVNSHGTGSHHNDISETKAIKLALGDAAGDVAISSTKSTIGHLMGAAGTVEAISTLFALRDRVAPPTLGLEEPDDGLDLNYVPQTPQPLPTPDGERPIGISNSFGLGGHNAVVVLRAA